jgi:single-strand DNA-binding protein
MTGIEAAFAGIVARDAEARTTTAGKPWVRFSVGVGSGDSIEWVSAAVFSESLQVRAAELKKGEKVYCEGTLRVDRWTAKDGTAKTSLSAAVFRLELLNQIGNRRPRSTRQKPATKPANGRSFEPELNDEIPF